MTLRTAYLRYILFLALAVSVAAGLTWIADEIWQTGVWWNDLETD